MRLTSVIVLLAIVGGAGYVLVFKRDWLFSKVKEGTQALEGYTPAKSPREAMELFMKAIKKRNYDAAAKYCSGDYEEKLRKAHAGASEVGGLIDDINGQIDNQGFRTDKTTFLLYHLDPFPNNFKIGDVKEDKKDADKAVGYFVLELIDIGLKPPSESNSLDVKMFTQCLRNPVISPILIKTTPLEIKAVTKDDERHWLINAPMNPLYHEQILYFIDHYKSYVRGLSQLKTRLRQDRYLKEQVFPDLVDVLKQSK
jgi:hypothetical protein